MESLMTNGEYGPAECNNNSISKKYSAEEYPAVDMTECLGDTSSGPPMAMAQSTVTNSCTEKLSHSFSGHPCDKVDDGSATAAAIEEDKHGNLELHDGSATDRIAGFYSELECADNMIPSKLSGRVEVRSVSPLDNECLVSSAASVSPTEVTAEQFTNDLDNSVTLMHSEFPQSKTALCSSTPDQVRISMDMCRLGTEQTTFTTKTDNSKPLNHDQSSSIFEQTTSNEYVQTSTSPLSSACETSSLFCLTCHESIAFDEEHIHSSHDTVKKTSAISSQQAACSTLLDASEKCLVNTEKWQQHISSLRSNLVKDRKAIAVELDELFREVEKRLQERKMDLFTQLMDCSCSKESYLDDRLEDMDSMHHQLSELVQSVSMIKKEVDGGKLAAGNCEKLKARADEVDQHAGKINAFSISTNTCLKFNRKGISEVKKSIGSLASVSTSSIIPSKSTASGDGLKKANVHKQVFVRVTPRDAQSRIVKEKDLVLQTNLCNEEVNVECQSIDNGNGTYSIVYIAPQPGVYHLVIKIFHQHVKGSPFRLEAVAGSRVSFSKSTNSYEITKVPQHKAKSPTVQVSKNSLSRTTSPRTLSSADSFSSLKILPASPSVHNASSSVQPPYGDYLAIIGEFGRRKGDFSNPQGVAVDSYNNIYCTDSTNQAIQVFSESGLYLTNVGKRGRQPGQLLRPIGISYSRNGYLLFTDYENKCINVFQDGDFVRRIGQGKLIGPKGITTTPRGTVIVADNKGNQVLEFSITGRLIRKLQSRTGDKASYLAGPHYVAVNEQGDIYVSDFHNHCIKVYNKEGIFQGAFGNHGTGNGQFNAPTGLAIDKQGRVLVSDWGNSRIQIFDSEGSFLTLVDTSAAPLFGPQSICMLDDSKVIVADSGNHCIKIFQYDAT